MGAFLPSHKSAYKPSKDEAATLAPLKGRKVLLITTSQKTLDTLDEKTGKVIKVGKPTGVYASEMTDPYYVFTDTGLDVTMASIHGGEIPIEDLSLRFFVRTEYDSRFLAERSAEEKNTKAGEASSPTSLPYKVKHSLSIEGGQVDVSQYDLVFMSGGSGAAYDFAQSDGLSKVITQAYAEGKILGSVCHGSLGFIGATKPDGSPLVQGVKMTGVTNSQLKQLGIGGSQLGKHPETELKQAGADYQSTSGTVSDLLTGQVAVDPQHRMVTGQNQKDGKEAAYRAMFMLLQAPTDASTDVPTES